MVTRRAKPPVCELLAVSQVIKHRTTVPQSIRAIAHLWGHRSGNSFVPFYHGSDKTDYARSVLITTLAFLRAAGSGFFFVHSWDSANNAAPIWASAIPKRSTALMFSRARCHELPGCLGSPICGPRRPGSQGAYRSWVRCGGIAGAQQCPTTQHCPAMSARAPMFFCVGDVPRIGQAGPGSGLAVGADLLWQR